MNHFLTALVLAALVFTLPACGNSDPTSADSSAPISPTLEGTAPTLEIMDGVITTPGRDLPDGTMPITIRIGEQSFSATLADNDGARALAERLPVTLELSELHGNEKYYYLEEGLPTDSETPGQINAGDLMLYGSDCLVLFYESFSSGYSYTRLGGVEDTSGLAEALGTGSVTVTMEVA